MNADGVIFQESPVVEIATNKFINVATIIQWEDTPLMEVGKFEPAGYTTRFSIYHSDGTKIAVVKGAQIYPTDEGKKALVKLRFEPNLTACELEGKTLYELRRSGATALKGWAELYAPEGVFIKASDSDLSAMLGNGECLQVGGMRLINSIFDGHDIGIHITRTSISLGGSGGRSMKAELESGWVMVATGGGSVTFGSGPPLLSADPKDGEAEIQIAMRPDNG